MALQCATSEPMWHDLRTYAPWILLPAIGLVIALYVAGGRSGGSTFAGSDEGQFLRDPKLKRTTRSFLDPASPSPEPPLYTINREGLPITMTFDAEQWRLMRHLSNRRTYKERSIPVTIRFGDRQPRAAMVHLRGGGSLNHPTRPNFRVSLLRAEEFTAELETKTLFLMNMSQDAAQIKTAFAYGVLRKLGLFYPHTQYVSVNVNDEPLGMFLLVEPPVAAIRRRFDDVTSIYRRRNENLYSTEWTDPVPNANGGIDQLISANLSNDSSPSLAETFANLIDLDQLFTWICFNSSIYNTDMLDELFIYERRTDKNQPGKLGMMAWDYDDIFLTKPRRVAFADPLIYSSSDHLDLKIKNIPALYAKLREKMAAMLKTTLAEERLVGDLRRMQQLRDSLDDGLPADVQARDRAARERIATEYEALLRRRHAELRAALNAK